MRELRRVCVFCGSSAGTLPATHDAARDLALTMAKQDIGLVYGGAQIGVMGTLADTMLAAGGEAIGVLPDGQFSREVPHTSLSQLHLVSSMHERKQLMYELADGFIVLPGGLGTLDELFEAATWNQLQLHEPLKPISLLSYDGFWESLLEFLDRTVDAGYVKARSRGMLQHATSARQALEQLRTFVF